VKTSKDRFLTTHVGSLPRPANLAEYETKRAAGEPVDEQEHDANLTAAVARVVTQQADAGIDVISDGEFGKFGWTNYVIDRMTGFEQRDVARHPVTYLGFDAEGRFKDFFDGPDGRPQTRSRTRSLMRTQAVCTGPITYTDEGRAAMQRDVDNFKAALGSVAVQDAFLPVVAPCSIAADYANEYYASDEEFLFAVADALHEEYKTITDAGLIVQTDDATLVNFHDMVVHSGRDYRAFVQMNIEATNHALRGIPPEQVRYHLCWGSWPGPHTTDVPLREVIDQVLQVNAGAFAIEGANPRHEWEWEVWADVKLPDGKLLLPGVISHAIAHVEHPELVAQRLLRYAGVVGAENVIGSSDCGFAQSATISRQVESIVWAKLESLVEGARLATERRGRL
jgi:5-methyltetrahydropteroyltriglutamate--homocysteine methyltransferase